MGQLLDEKSQNRVGMAADVAPTDKNDALKVLVVDDHAMFREGLRVLLSVCNDIKIIGEASDGNEAVDKAKELNPDVVLMDLAMPVMDGLTATRHIMKFNPRAKVLVLTRYDDCDHVIASIKAGASGYVPKRAVGAELVSAIRAMRRDEGFLYPSAASCMIQRYRQQAEKEPYDILTEREREVLKLIAEGHTGREIAVRLCISLKTVLGHRTNIMSKLNIHNRTSLVKYALRQGITELEP